LRRVGIVQARMTSTRLPGKVLATVAGHPMLAQQVRRLKASRNLDEIMVATTVNASDDPVVALAQAEQVAWFRGDEHDVLARYLGAARAAKAEMVVRMTADCPLIDPQIVDLVVAAACESGCDYASNTIHRTYPRGLDVEAFHVDVLERMDRLATSAPAREHVTYHLHRERPDLFLIRNVADEEDHSDLRWTVDTDVDLRLVRAVFDLARLGERTLPYRELVHLVCSRPELRTLNAEVVQKAE
jgi:spore coat polysaccharide biosynthesis protein SpsF